MVGVGEGVLGDVPGSVPTQLIPIHQKPHQLGNSNGGVCVIQLDGYLLVELVKILVVSPLVIDDVLERTADEEILLLQSQLFALGGIVVGIENFRDILREDLGRYGTDIVTAVENLKVELFTGSSPPEAPGIHCIVGSEE